MTEFEIILQTPPSVNEYWKYWRGRVTISPAGTNFRWQVALLLKSRRIQPMTGPLTVMILASPPDYRRRDLDNILKALLDALEHGGAYENDYQIAKLMVERGPVQPIGTVKVRISQYDGLSSMWK